MSDLLSRLHFGSGPQLPVMLQTEVAECGLACLAMVAGFHGHQIDLNTLRRDFPITLRGVTLTDLIRIAQKMKFTARPLKLELEEMGQLRTPAILHWDMNHFVVLKSVHTNHIVIHDPAQGLRKVSMTEASKHFTGIGLELSPTPEFEKKDERDKLPFSAFFKNAKGLMGALSKVLILSLSLQIFAVLSPFYMQWIVDEAIVPHDENLITVLSIGFLMLSIIIVTTTAFRSYVVMRISNLMSIQMGAHLFSHLIRLPLTYFEKRHIGDVVSRFSSLNTIKDLITTGIVEAMVDGLMALITLIVIWVYSAKLAMVVMFFVALYAAFRLMWYRPFRQMNEEVIVTKAKENTNFMESVRGIQSIKIFGKESQRQTLWENCFADSLNVGIRTTKMRIVYQLMNGLLFGIQNICVVYLGAHMVLEQSFSIGMLFAFIAYKEQFTTKAGTLVDKYIDIKMISLHLERLADIALTEKEPALLAQESTQTGFEGALRLEGIRYSYEQTDTPVFSHIDLTVTPGQSIAIIGPSGCGKTTLMKVMMGLFEPNGGEVYVDDKPLKQFGVQNYRQHIAAVMQNDQLLSGSILENITFFESEVDESRLANVCAIAAIDKDIAKMPMGYNTLIGDMGTTLSGGQKQRILLARALYRMPKILFLDEATSHLDVPLEKAVSQAIQQLNITRIIIAHRPETIKSADKVFAMMPEGLVEKRLQSGS